MSIQSRLIQADGYAVLSGIEMLAKAALESGADLLVGAQLDGPTPYADLLSDHAALLKDKGFRTLIQPDARQAVAAMIGAYRNGQSVVGVVDALGVVDAAGMLLSSQAPLDDVDDPGAFLLCFGSSDTSVGEAAGALLRRAGWVVIEPALQDEVLSFAKAGFELGRVSGKPIALALPRDLMHGTATVACSANRYPASDRSDKPSDRAFDNTDPTAAVLSEARSLRINAAVNPSGKDEDLPLALVTIGRSFGWTRQAMAELGLAGRLPILRLGVVAPLDRALIHKHTASCREVLILDPTGLGVGEAVRDVIGQRQARQPIATDGTAYDPAGDPTDEPLVTQVTTIDLDAQAGPGDLARVLKPWLELHPTLPRELVTSGFDRLRTVDMGYASDPAGLADRSVSPPPGSSLVDVSVVLGRLRRDLSDAQHMLEQHRTGPIDLAVFGELDDTAKLLLSRWQTLQGGLDCDGRLAGGAAAGASAREGAARSVVLMSSRRFFSLGVSAIADSVRAGRSAVYIIHTEDPAEAVGPKRRFKRRPKVSTLDMQAVIEGINAGRREPTPSVTTIDPSDRPRMRRLLERLVLSEGVHVVIARRRRGPRYYRKASEVHRKQSARRGYLAKQGCLVHCPEAGPISARRRLELGILGVEPTAHAPDPWTVSVSWSWHDETVMHALAEPAVGLAILERNQPERSRVVPQDLDDLPAPPKPIHANADAWRATLTGITGSAYDLTLQMLLEAGAAMGYLVRCSSSVHPTEGPEPRRADVLFTRHEPKNAPYVPAAPGRASSPMLTAQPMPGHADLLLGTELAESARWVAARDSPYGCHCTHALVDDLVIPTVMALASGRVPDRETMVDAMREDGGRSNAATISVLPIARLAEWLWGHQRYAAWVYLGLLVQRGQIPLTIKAIESAGRRIFGLADPRASEAMRVGRKLAIDPGYADRVMTPTQSAMKDHVRLLADDLAQMPAGRADGSVAGAYQAMVEPLIDRSEDLPDRVRRQIAATAQRCVFWAGVSNGIAYCQRYVDAVERVLSIDDSAHQYELTRAAIAGLDRAMLIPDEVYLAALLTAPARYRRDRQRFNISLEQGDKIRYVHLLRPEFDLFKRRVAFTIILGERAMKAVARMHVLRRIRPGWYRTQRDFRDFYLQTLNDLPTPQSEAAYRHALEMVSVATTIRGRGDVRRDSVQSARRTLDKLIVGIEEA